MLQGKDEEPRVVEYSYDEAVELTGHGRYNHLLLLTCSIISNGVAIDAFGFAVVIATASCDLHLTISRIGLLASMPFVGLLFAFVWGYYADTRGRRHALMLSSFVGSAMAALGSLSPNWQTLLVTKLIGCSFSLAANSLTMAYLGECTGNKRRSEYMFIMNSINLAGEAVTFILALLIMSLTFDIPIHWMGIAYRPWRLLTLLLALPLGIGAVMLTFLHESPKFLANSGQNEKALKVLRKMFEVNGGKKEEYQVKALTKSSHVHNDQPLWESLKQQTVPIFKPPLLWRTLQLFYLMIICCTTNNVFVMWYPTIVNSFFASLSNGITDDRSFCDRSVANLTASHSDIGDLTCKDTISTNTIYAGIVTGLFFATVSLCVSKLAAWRRLVLITTLVIPAVCNALLNVTGNPIISLMLFALVQATAIGIAVVGSYCVDLYSTSYRGVVTSLAMMAARLGSFSGVNIVGQAITSNCQLTFYCFAALVFSFGKYNAVILVVCLFMTVAMAFESLSVSYLVPASACELNTTTAQQGLMAAVPLIGILATSHVWGYLADTRGRRTILQVSLLLGSVSGALAGLSPHWLVFCLLKFLSCCGVSGTLAISFTLLAETTPRDKRNILMLMTNSFYLLSTGAMAVLTIPILPLTFSHYIPYLDIYFNSWRLLNIIYSMPCALGVVSLVFAYESPKYLLTVGLEEESLDVLKAMYAMNTGKHPEEFQVKSLSLGEGAISQSAYKTVWESVKAQTLPLTKTPLLQKTLLLAVMFCTIYSCIHPYIVWLPFIADGFMRSIMKGETDLTICQMLRSTQESQNQTLFLKDEPQDCSLNEFAMIIVLINGCVLAVLNLVLTGLVNYFGKKRLLITIQFATGIAGICVNVSSNWIISAVVFMLFMASGLNFGVLNTFSVSIYPTYLKAMAVCLTLMVGRASAFFSINLLKQLLITNCELSFYLFGGLTIAAGFVAFLLPADEANPKPEQGRCPET